MMLLRFLINMNKQKLKTAYEPIELDSTHSSIFKKL